MGKDILDSGDARALQRRAEEDASGRGGTGVTGGVSISASSWKSLINKITGKGESDAQVKIGLIDVPRDGDEAIKKLTDGYQREYHGKEDTKEDRKQPEKNSENVPLPKHIQENMERSLAQAREEAKKHGLEGKAHDGGASSPTDTYAHNAQKAEKTKSKDPIIAGR